MSINSLRVAGSGIWGNTGLVRLFRSVLIGARASAIVAPVLALNSACINSNSG